MPVKSPLYDRDFYAWSREQAELLRAGKLDRADIEHIAEEIDSMGRTEKRELVSRLSVLLRGPQMALSAGQARSEPGSEHLEPARRRRRSSRRQSKPEAAPAAGVGVRVSQGAARGGRRDGARRRDLSRGLSVDGGAGAGRRFFAVGVRAIDFGREQTAT